MGITLDQLVYDATDGGAEVGSHVLAGTDGTAIGHTGDALHVDVQNASIVVTATDLDIRDLNFATDSVTSRLNDGAGNSITSTAGALDVNIDNASIAVTAADLDIRDLTHASDSVKVGDGTEFLAINTDGSINIKQAAPSNPQRSAATVGTSAVELFATPLTDRTRILVQNNGSKDIYIGEDNTVTTATGIKIPRGASMELPYGAAANIWAISTAAGQDVRGYELD